ncbi:MAG: HD-GYP domain-containing protein [Rubrivivax sp.]|nr:HD-GYP domain-containing protein [Rubrivivax sp.]
MLKKIAVSDVRLGMHLHALEGSWIAHPFWKTRFVVDSIEDLRKLQSSGVAECWIDVSLGLDVATPQAPEQAVPPPAVWTPGPASASGPVAAREPPRGLSEEVLQAAALCRRSRQAVVDMFAEARLGKALQAERCMPLVEEISASVYRNPSAIVSLARLKSRDDYTYMHSVAVCALMVALARQLGLDDDSCRAAGFAGLLHDMGKALMPLEILNKPGKLTDAEFQIMRSHPERGRQLLSEGQGVDEPVLDVCLHHHERVDGRGYPHRLTGEQMTQIARMGAVCDVYDAITSNRPYKGGWDPAESIARMASWKGHFDAAIFQAFVRSLGIYPVGSLVRLQSQQLAIVVEQHPASLTTPWVKIFYSLKSQMPVSPRLLDLSRTQDRILGREPAEPWAKLNLDALWAGDALPARR